jgi:DNA-directed DNA polymerase III PolC
MLQVHSYYSLKYGVVSPEEIANWAKTSGYSNFLITDINSTTAGLSFIKRCQELEIQATVGVDFKNGIHTCYLIIAKNNRGFHELNQFLSLHLHQHIQFPDRPPYFRNCWVIYPWGKQPKILVDNEFIGIHALQLNRLHLEKKKLPEDRLVSLQTMSFRHKKDFNTHRLLRAIALNCLLSKLPPEEQAKEEHLFITQTALEEQFKDFPELLFNTRKLLAQSHVHFEFGSEIPPQNIETYTGSKAEDLRLIHQLCKEGIAYRYPLVTEEINKRIALEIDIIAQKNYLSYFLVTWDFTSYARSKGYFYVGRGSGANSIVAYLLRITDVDPLELDLYFERFINLYRKNPPDFDIDFSWKDRDDVTRYIFERYPTATLLCTYNTFQYRATIRELGKVFGLPKTEIDLLSRSKGNVHELDQISQLVVRYSQYIEGLPSHLSIHAGGIVISERPITWFSGTFMPPKGFPTTQFSMLEAEDVGLYKFDVLSQRGLGKIKDCLDVIAYNQAENIPHDIHDIDYLKKDERIKELLKNAKAIGCFYVESPAMRMLLSKLQVDNYLALVAASSIIRPGVAQSGMMRAYILRHRFPERRKESHPIMLEIMPETYGVMVYQEDVIKVAHHFANLDLAEADILRRGMSGKFRSREEFQHVKDKFFSNCLAKKHSLELTQEIWRQIESFAGYSFSKGHSASYAVESYQSLYLKAHYPLEYMVATINNFGGYYRTEIYVHEARMWDAKIEAPSINYGDYQCTIYNQTIYLGFNLVNGAESQVLIQIFEERKENGKYIDLDDLCKRVPIPLEQLLLIIRIGALRDFSASRKELLWKAHFMQKGKIKNPLLQLFPQKSKDFLFPNLQDSELEIAFEQLELLGFPLCNIFDLLAKKLPEHILSRQLKEHLGLRITTYGYLVALKHSKTSRGEYMYFGTFYDIEGNCIDTVHFPESGRKYPFRGRGVYQILGVVVEEFGFFSLEVGEMYKLPFMEDVRFSEEIEPSKFKENRA